MTNFGESVFGVRGLKSKIEEQCSVEGFMDNWRPKHGSIPSINKKNNLKFGINRQTDGQMDRRTDRSTDYRQSQRQKIINS